MTQGLRNRQPMEPVAARMSVLDVLARRDRWVMGASLALLTLLSWLTLAATADATNAMDGGDGESAFMWLMPMGRWGPTEFALAFAMWIVMMVGMMTPSASPMLFAFARVSRSRSENGRAAGSIAAFFLGYLLVWSAFSLAAAAAQWLLHLSMLLTPAMASASRRFDAALLVAAGLYQFTPLKYACLAKCRVPLGFLMTEWRDGARGALAMGAKHGAWCVGCCWLLMALLFVAGVMNLLWIGLLAALVCAEKALPAGRRVAAVAGALMVVAGVAILAKI